MPKFTSALGDTTCLIGNETKLSATVEGFPKPDITAFKDSQKIVFDKNIKMQYEDGKVDLCINNASHQNTGKYKLEAKNVVGADSVEGLLDVLGKA